MKYDALFLSFLIFCPAHPNKQLTEREQFELAKQEEKDYQEFRLKVLATIGTIALAAIAAYVQLYVDKK